MPKDAPKSIAAFRKKMATASTFERATMRRKLNRNLRASVHRGQITEERAKQIRNTTLRRGIKQLKAKKTQKAKKLLKRARGVLGKQSESMELLRALKHFLSKAIDAYESDDMDREERDTLDTMFGEMGAAIIDFLQENEDARDPDYAELEDYDFMIHNFSDYIRMFHDYYMDRLRDYSKKPTEDKKVTLTGLTKEVTEVLRKYSPEPDNAMAAANETGWGGEEAPEAVRDELAELLGKMKM